VSKKPLLPRGLARRDVEAAIDRYLREAGPDVALGFIESLRVAYRVISDHPLIGSPRYADELGIPGLRSLVLKRYSYLVLYVERDDTLTYGVSSMP
jgi:toxin ParE1/3/4